jgi:hypothetical protein
MPDDQERAPTSAPFSFDAEKFSKLYDNLRGSFRTYVEDSTIATEKMTGMNKEIGAFHERLMLLDLGTIGLSVSALISFVSKFTLMGFHKHVVIALASGAWCLLLISAICCRSVTTKCLAANRKLLHDWMFGVSDMNGAAIVADMHRLSDAFIGVATVNDATFDPKAIFAQLAIDSKAKFDEAKLDYLNKCVSNLSIDTKAVGRAGMWAILLMQLALLLLGVTAVALFAGM